MNEQVFTISFNYCKCRRFRKLYNGICSGCLGYEPELKPYSEPKPKLKNNSTKVKQKIDKVSTKQIKEKKPKDNTKQLEEQILLNELQSKPLRYKEKWLQEISEKIGWDLHKTKKVARRLERKKLVIKSRSDDLIIDILKQYPDGLTPKEIREKLDFSNLLTLYNVLKNMLTDNRIKRKNGLKSIYILVE